MKKDLDKKEIYVYTDDIKQSYKWRKVRTIHIKNEG